MKYKVGDRVVFKNAIFLFDAEILEVYENNEYDEYDYYIRYEDYEKENIEILLREEDIIEYAKGTDKHLKQEIDKLLKMYSKEEILSFLK